MTAKMKRAKPKNDDGYTKIEALRIGLRALSAAMADHAKASDKKLLPLLEITEVTSGENGALLLIDRALLSFSIDPSFKMPKVEVALSAKRRQGPAGVYRHNRSSDRLTRIG